MGAAKDYCRRRISNALLDFIFQTRFVFAASGYESAIPATSELAMILLLPIVDYACCRVRRRSPSGSGREMAQTNGNFCNRALKRRASLRWGQARFLP